jgi:hypothetical protein
MVRSVELMFSKTLQPQMNAGGRRWTQNKATARNRPLACSRVQPQLWSFISIHRVAQPVQRFTGGALPAQRSPARRFAVAMFYQPQRFGDGSGIRPPAAM